MASVLDLVKHYQHSIEKYPNDEQKILKCIDKLYNLDVKVQHLQETGVGRTVNALRKEPGDVGQAARALVYKWKVMVAAEESDQEDQNNDTTSHNGHENGKSYETHSSESQNRHKYEKSERTPKAEERQHKHTNGDYGSKRKYESSEEEDSHTKKSKYSNTKDNNYKSKSGSVEESEADTQDDSSQSESDSEDSQSSEEEKKPDVKVKEVERNEKLERHHQSSKHSSSSDKYNDSRNSKEKQKHNDVEAKHSEKPSKEKSHSHTHKSSRENNGSSKENENNRRDKDHHKSSEKERKHREDNIIKHTDRHRTTSSSDKQKSSESSEKHKSSSSSEKHKSSSHPEKHKTSSSSEKHKSSSSEKHRTHSEKSSSNAEKGSSHSDKHSSSKSGKEKNKHSSEKENDKHKSKETSGSNSNTSGSGSKDSSSSKEKLKDKSSSREKDHSHKSEKKHSTKEESKSSDKRKSDSDHDKSSKKIKHKSSSSSKSSNKSKDDEPKKKKGEDSDDGIDCGSGASFAEALGMISPAKPKKKTSFKDSTMSPNSGNEDQSPATLLAPTAKLAPLPALEILALPEISPNYRPRPPPKFLPHFTDEEALSAGIFSKNQRTKVFSGNKVIGKITTLYEMCVHVLQEHIDALEYTGGVPYEILKPVVDKATPQQLFVLEHYNPYLMEDTDHLWQKHCEKNFRNKKRQEMETWREMYMRCQEEQEIKLKSLTANIKIAQEAKKAPIKQTKMAYVDSVVKPPRNILKKQAQHGTAFAATASPAARVASLASAPNVLKGGRAAPMPVTTSSSSSFKPKKAPLMQKALQFMRGRKR